MTTINGNKQNGLYKDWYSDGVKCIETTYIDVEQNDLYQGWYLDGIKYSETTYVDGKRSGLWQEWHVNGSSEIYEYKNNIIISIVSIRDDLGRECVLTQLIQEGKELIVWKECKSGEHNVFVELKVPIEAKRITPTNSESRYKSRVEYAIVQRIFDIVGTEYKEASSCVYSSSILTYKVGELIRPDGFDDNITNECGRGINVHAYQDHCRQWFK